MARGRSTRTISVMRDEVDPDQLAVNAELSLAATLETWKGSPKVKLPSRAVVFKRGERL